MTTTKAIETTLESFIQDYNKRTQSSKALADRNRPVLADKTSIGLGFSSELKELCYPIASDHAHGSHMWDIDGNEYIDILMGLGLNLLGHNPDFVQQAIVTQLSTGTHIGSQTALAGEVAQLICDLTGMERVTFSNTGTEAMMTAVRIARAATGRSKIVVFTNSYHGHFDAVLNRAKMTEYARKAARRVIEQKSRSSSLIDTITKPLQWLISNTMDSGATPAMRGIPKSAARDVLMLEYDNPHSLAIIRQHRRSLAAVLVEPVQSRTPELQPRAFLQNLRQVTQDHDIALIFDEMVTGFRIHPGGAQAHFGVKADMATYSKIAGGGLPMSAIAGQRRWLDHIDGGAWQYGDDSRPTVPTTFFAGTFCKHPLSLAAARATLQHLKDSGPKLQADLNDRTTEFVAELNQIMIRREWSVRFVSFGSFFAIALSQSNIPDKALNLLSYQLINRGIHLRQGDRGGFLSTAHSDRDLQLIIQAFEASFDALEKMGILTQ